MNITQFIMNNWQILPKNKGIIRKLHVNLQY